MNDKEEKSKLLRSLISKVVANKKDEDEEKANKKAEAARKKAEASDEGENEKDAKGNVKMPPHPLLGNTGSKGKQSSKKTPNFEKILPGLQEKSTRTGNAVSNIQNKLMQKRSTRRGR